MKQIRVRLELVNIRSLSIYLFLPACCVVVRLAYVHLFKLTSRQAQSVKRKTVNRKRHQAIGIRC